MRSKVLAIVYAVLLIASTELLYAPGPPPPPPATSGPIDRGALILLIAVAGYGFLRIKRSEKPIG